MHFFPRERSVVMRRTVFFFFTKYFIWLTFSSQNLYSRYAGRERKMARDQDVWRLASSTKVVTVTSVHSLVSVSPKEYHFCNGKARQATNNYIFYFYNLCWTVRLIYLFFMTYFIIIYIFIIIYLFYYLYKKFK